MELEDIIPNEYYSTICSLGGRAVLLVSKEGENNYDYFLSTKENYFSRNSHWNGYKIQENLKLATPLEKAWLQECIKQEKFVSLDKIKVNNNYRLWKLKISC